MSTPTQETQTDPLEQLAGIAASVTQLSESLATIAARIDALEDAATTPGESAPEVGPSAEDPPNPSQVVEKGGVLSTPHGTPQGIGAMHTTEFFAQMGNAFYAALAANSASAGDPVTAPLPATPTAPQASEWHKNPTSIAKDIYVQRMVEANPEDPNAGLRAEIRWEQESKAAK